MPKKTVVFTLLIFFAIHVFGQNKGSKLIGMVVESETSEPMQFVNVGLYTSEDTVLISASVTDVKGQFELVNIPDGSYFIIFSFIGFESKESEVFTFEEISEIKNMGTIDLNSGALSLDEVEIKAQKSLSNFAIDKKVYNVEQDVMAQSGNATQILANIPSVTVDIGGQVSLRGTSNITFFINGRPSTLMRLNSTTALQQIPASNIERIEVITNPSAKYKPDGAGGIINIVLKKATERGTNGAVMANIGNNERYTGNISLNHSTTNTNIYGSYGFRHSPSPRIQTDERLIKDSLKQILSYYDNQTKKQNIDISHVFNGGIDHSFDDKNKLGIQGNILFGQNKSESNIVTVTHDLYNNLTSSFTSYNTEDDHGVEYETNFIYQHLFTEEQVLSFSGNYANYREKEDVYFTDHYDIPKDQSVYAHNVTIKHGPLANLFLEYTTPLAGGSIETGYVYELFRDNIDFVHESKPSERDEWTYDTSKSYLFIFTQQIHAAYGIFSNTIGNFGYKTGVRMEQVFVESHLASLDSIVPHAYFKIYPTMHFSYKFNEQQQLQLSYSRRVNRADSDEYNPLPDYKSTREVELGNPKLLPEQIHSIELGYELKKEKYSLISSIYLRQKYDGFARVNSFVDDSVLLRTYVNLTSESTTGAEFILSSQIGNIFEIDLSVNGFHNTIDASNLVYSPNSSAFSWNSKLSLRANLSPSTFLQVNPNYKSRIITAQGHRKEVFVMNCGLRQDLFDNKASLTFTVSDIFNTLRRQTLLDTPYLEQYTNYKRQSRIFSLGFVYKFGGSEKGRRDLHYDNSL